MPAPGGEPGRGELLRATPWEAASSSFNLTSFSPATLWLSKVTLSRSGNQLHVSLQLPTSCWANLTYEGSYAAWGEYLARVQRVSNNQEVSLSPSPVTR